MHPLLHCRLNHPLLHLSAVGRPEAIPLPQQTHSYSAKKKSTLKSSLSLALLLVLCTALYLTNPAQSLARAFAQWAGDLSLQGYDGASCPAQAEPLNVGIDWRPLESEEYREVAAKRLIGAVQIVSRSGGWAEGSRRELVTAER